MKNFKLFDLLKALRQSRFLYHRFLIAMFFLSASPAFAANTAARYPWAKVLISIQESISGPVAYAIAIIAVVGSGIAMAFLDLQGGAKKFVQVALGCSIAFGAATILSTLMPNFGGVVV